MKFLALFIAFTLSLCSYAQRFTNISTFTTQNGLSNNTITALQKDSAGFLWIGTHEGLNRYDGTAFINVLSNSYNNLPSNNIGRICLIDQSILAIATDAGLCFLNTSTLKGRKIDIPFHAEFPGNGYFIEDILFDKTTNQLWVATWHGLFVLNQKGQLIKKIMSTEQDLAKGAMAKRLLMDAQRNVYFYSMQKSGFYYPVFEKNDLLPVQQRDRSFLLNDFLGKGFSLRSAQMLDHETTCIVSKFSLTGSEEYLAYHNLITGKSFLEKIAVDFNYEKRLLNAFPLDDSVFLVNSYFGEPLLYNTNEHRLRKASNHPLWFTSWPDGIGSLLFQDRQYTWIATANGLLQSVEKPSSFKKSILLVDTINRNKGLVSFNYGFYDKGKLWVSCMGAGLFCFDSITNSVQPVFTKNTNPAFLKKLISTEVLNAGNSLWLYSVYGPLQIDRTTRKMKLVDGINKDSAFDDAAGFPFRDSKGNIWSTLPDGLCRYDTTNGLFTNYKTIRRGGNFPLLRAGPKAEDGNGNIWAARQDTLVSFNPATLKFETRLLVKDGRSLRPVNLMTSDGGDILYMKIAGAFAIYHISTGNIDLFTKQTGIISTAINDIASDKFGNAWIGTEAGLVLYNKQRKKFSSYTKADGLPGDNIIALNFADEARTILFLGFAKTYCLFMPSGFLLEKSLPQNRITEVTINGETLLGDEMRDLSYNENSVSFSYTGINFSQGQQNNYACILEGFDQDWKYQGTERKINYINLPPGTYNFKVKSANHQGEWNEQPATFSFVITPPFWQRWWFRGLLLVMAVAGLYYFIKRREVNIKKENELKLQMSELRMQALRAQMNPHFIFNSLNSIQHYILNNNTMDAAGYLSKFAKLIRRILDQSKHNFLPLREVMETLHMYVEIEAFRFNNEFSFQFHIEEDEELQDALIPPMLLQPFVENAILHGLMPKTGDKILIISCKMSENQAIIIIDDNGVGRTDRLPKAGHDSQGEKLTAGMLESLQQIKNIKASIDIVDKTENGLPAGTTIKLAFSVN